MDFLSLMVPNAALSSYNLMLSYVETSGCQGYTWYMEEDQLVKYDLNLVQVSASDVVEWPGVLSLFPLIGCWCRY